MTTTSKMNCYVMKVINANYELYIQDSHKYSMEGVIEGHEDE